MFGDTDLKVFFADFGVPVVFGAVTALGLLDVETDVFSHGAGPGGVERVNYRLRLPWNAFSPSPQPTDTILVNGASYQVLSLPTQKDMQILELALKAVP